MKLESLYTFSICTCENRYVVVKTIIVLFNNIVFFLKTSITNFYLKNKYNLYIL